MMTNKKMTSDEEHAYYADPANQVPAGKPVRRRPLGAPVPVRFDEKTLEAIRRRAAADDRSVSSWIRRAAEHELDRDAS